MSQSGGAQGLPTATVAVDQAGSAVDASNAAVVSASQGGEGNAAEIAEADAALADARGAVDAARAAVDAAAAEASAGGQPGSSQASQEAVDALGRAADAASRAAEALIVAAEAGQSGGEDGSDGSGSGGTLASAAADMEAASAVLVAAAGEIAADNGLPPPVPANGSAAQGTVVQVEDGTWSGSGGKTAEERIAELDEQLMGSVAVFDQTLIRTAGLPGNPNGDFEAGLPPDVEDANNGAGGSAEVGDRGGASAQAPAASGSNRGSMPEGAVAREGEFKKTPPAQNSEIPEDIPDGSDDDIVARQIREAAMAETDPELAERLWEEYRNYKAATSN